MGDMADWIIENGLMGDEWEDCRCVRCGEELETEGELKTGVCKKCEVVELGGKR